MTMGRSQTGQPEFDVQEGDVIIFPSWTKHRAPATNESENMKTIISEHGR